MNIIVRYALTHFCRLLLIIGFCIFVNGVFSNRIAGGTIQQSPQSPPRLITGRVFDSNGRPVPGIQVALIPAGQSAESSNMLQITNTNGEGKFVLAGLPNMAWVIGLPS